MIKSAVLITLALAASLHVSLTHYVLPISFLVENLNNFLNSCFRNDHLYIMEIISTTVTIYSFLNEHAVLKSILQLAHFLSNFIISYETNG